MITQPKGNQPKTKGGHWFRSMSANMQKVYVEKHPKTRFKATAARAKYSEAAIEGKMRHRKAEEKRLAKTVGIKSAKARKLMTHHIMSELAHHKSGMKSLDKAYRHKAGSRWHTYHMKKAQTAFAKQKRHQRTWSKIYNMHKPA